MSNHFFQFKEFGLQQIHSAMKFGVDSMTLGSWANPGKATRILDIGAGTGVLSLMMAQVSAASIYAVEIDEQACIDAAYNFKQSPWKNRLHLIQDSFQAFAAETKLSFDFMISNPPYFSNSLKPDREQRKTARHNDLLPDADLLFLVKTLLSDSGRFVLILPSLRADEFRVKANAYGLFEGRILRIYPSENKPSNRQIIEFSGFRQEPVVEQLVIHSDLKYSEDYIALTRRFYAKEF